MEYEISGKGFDDKDSAERFLTALFVDMCFDLEIDLGNDSAAWRESFNNWTDSLHRDGLICDSSVNDLCPIGERFE